MHVDSYSTVPWAFKDIFYISTALHHSVRIPHLLLLSHTGMCLFSLSTFKQELQKLEEEREFTVFKEILPLYHHHLYWLLGSSKPTKCWISSIMSEGLLWVYVFSTIEKQLFFSMFSSFHTKLMEPNLSLLIFFLVTHKKSTAALLKTPCLSTNRRVWAARSVPKIKV